MKNLYPILFIFLLGSCAGKDRKFEEHGIKFTIDKKWRIETRDSSYGYAVTLKHKNFIYRNSWIQVDQGDPVEPDTLMAITIDWFMTDTFYRDKEIDVVDRYTETRSGRQFLVADLTYKAVYNVWIVHIFLYEGCDGIIRIIYHTPRSHRKYTIKGLDKILSTIDCYPYVKMQD